MKLRTIYSGMNIELIPPALSALAGLPSLYAQCAASLAAQAQRIAERAALAVPRLGTLRQLEEQIGQGGGRTIALSGLPGSGLTTVLCTLAAQRPYAFWLPGDDAGAGLAALCAQVIALGALQPALLPPAAGCDSSTLERLLAEAGDQRLNGEPLVVIVGRPPSDQDAPLPPHWPTHIPPGIVLVQATAPDVPLSLVPNATIHLGDAASQELTAIARVVGSQPELATAIAAKADGSPLYARLAAEICQHSKAKLAKLPAGLTALHEYWWGKLTISQRQIVALLAASTTPLDLDFLAELSGSATAEISRLLQRWQPFFEQDDDTLRLYHPFTRAFVRAQCGDDLASAHSQFVAYAQRLSHGVFATLNSSPAHQAVVQELARHSALAASHIRAATIPALATRSWAVMRERISGTLGEAASDNTWLLRAAIGAAEPIVLVRLAMLGGVLTHAGRQLPPDAAAEAFSAAIANQAAREPTLRRIRAIIGQLPNGAPKAQALRRLGEVCYALRMRASAMRLLSEAIDIETPGPSRQWNDEREETLAAFARTAIASGQPQIALGITARIGHAERRGMVETEVVRWLLAQGQRTRAEEVAYAIGHTTMHEWAMAEVAVGHTRAGDRARGETVLGTLRTETAIAWARTELACDAARLGGEHAIGQLAPLKNTSLLDRALALVAPMLAAGNHFDAALQAANTIEDRSIRTNALITLSLQPIPHASQALAAATTELAELSGDERAPLVADLAAAQATFGQLEAALHTAALLAEDEERDRAQSRVAVALARVGNADDARLVAEAIGDDDERDWAFDELAHMAAEQAQWDVALAHAQQIAASGQRARTSADIAIAQARAGDAAAAQALAHRIELPTEQLRALLAIAEPLIAQGQLNTAEASLMRLPDPDKRSRYASAVVAALAGQQAITEAEAFAYQISRPLEQARALSAIARAAVPTDRARAQKALGQALLLAAQLGRAETLRCLEWVSTTLTQLGGPDLLLAAASTIDEIDHWWPG